MILEPDDALIELLMQLHATQPEKQHQSIRGGSEFTLLECGYKRVQKALRDLKRVINNGLEFSGVWSSLIPAGGFRVRHNHPQGYLSGCWYLIVHDNAPLCFDGMRIQPKPGEIIIFPSYLQHWVEPSDVQRLTIAFDMVRA